MNEALLGLIAAATTLLTALSGYVIIMQRSRAPMKTDEQREMWNRMNQVQIDNNLALRQVLDETRRQSATNDKILKGILDIRDIQTKISANQDVGNKRMDDIYSLERGRGR